MQRKPPCKCEDCLFLEDVESGFTSVLYTPSRHAYHKESFSLNDYRTIDAVDTIDLGDVVRPRRGLTRCFRETVADLENAVHDDCVDALVDLLLS